LASERDSNGRSVKEAMNPNKALWKTHEPLAEKRNRVGTLLSVGGNVWKNWARTQLN